MVFTGDGVAVDDVPEPGVTAPGDAVVRVETAGICGSDLHLLTGHTPGMKEGSVIGHEFVGRVVDAGDDVAIAEGARVVGSFLIACGRCGPCSERRFNHCRQRRALGLGTLTGDLDGAQAELVRVPDASVNLKVLDDSSASLSSESAVFCGDVLATGIYAAHLAGDVSGETACVIGAGPVGLLSAAALRRKGADVIVLDTDPERVSRARETFGFTAERTAGAEGEGVEAMSVVSGLTDGAGARVTVEAVGHPAAFRSALRTTADGGKVVVIGVYGAERYELAMGMAWIRGLEISFAGMTNVHAHWDEALEAVATGAIDPTATVTHRMPLDDAVEAYELFMSRAAMKVLLRP